jgi:CO/xanthine dehydrogenase Mo-binding subunit
MLGRAPSSVHLFEGHVGGGFGIRGELYPEDVLVCVAAMRLGRPVKWIEDRREHLIAANLPPTAHGTRGDRGHISASGTISFMTRHMFAHAATVPDLPPPCCPGRIARTRPSHGG